MAATLYTTAQVAEKFETTPRTLRKFLRATLDETPGKGSRYSITGKELAPLKKKFTAWSDAQVEAKAAKAEAAVEVEVDEVDSLDEVDGPTDEELAALDA